MVELRRGVTAGYRRTLGLINCHPDADVRTTQPTIIAWLEGCRTRAARQGYAIEEIRLHEPGLTPTGLNRRLEAAGVEGVVLVGAFRPAHLPRGWDVVWREWHQVKRTHFLARDGETTICRRGWVRNW